MASCTEAPKLRVLLDAHMLGTRETGNEVYCWNLVHQQDVFEQLGVEMFYALPENYPSTNGSRRTLTVSSGHDIRRLAIELPREIRRIRAHGLHVTYHAPFWLSIPYVVTIHDVSYRTHPRYHRLRSVIIQNVLGSLSALRARAVITVTEFCRKEILKVYPFLKGRVFVTPEAAAAYLFPRPKPAIERTCRKLQIGERYLLWVGAAQPRKNLERLVEAFLRATRDNDGVQLVLAGDHLTTAGAALKRRFAEAIQQRRVVLTGYVDEETLACLYSGCVAFVFPSLYEGFGLPILEAMQCGAPVITASVTSLPEVAGDAAILVDPTDTESISQAIRQVLADPHLRITLRERGLKRAAQFSWAQTAQLTAAVYRLAFGWHRGGSE